MPLINGFRAKPASRGKSLPEVEVGKVNYYIKIFGRYSYTEMATAVV